MACQPIEFTSSWISDRAEEYILVSSTVLHLLYLQPMTSILTQGFFSWEEFIRDKPENRLFEWLDTASDEAFR